MSIKEILVVGQNQETITDHEHRKKSSKRYNPIIKILWFIDIDCDINNQKIQKRPIIEKAAEHNPKRGIKNLDFQIL